MSRVERFSQDARKVITSAQDIAIATRSHTIETPHVLLGMLKSPESIACKVLTDLRIDYDKVLPVVLSTHPSEPETVDTPTLTPETKRLLETATQISEQRGDPSVGSEHLLLALVKGNDKSIRYLMREIRLEPEVVRSCVERVLMQERDELPQSKPFTEAAIAAAEAAAPDAPPVDDRTQVLQLVEAGTITPQEAAELLRTMRLAAVGLDARRTLVPLNEFDFAALRGRTLRFTVTDKETNAVTADVSLPFPQAQSELVRLLRAIFSGTRGTLLDIDGDTSRVKIDLD